MKKNDYIYWKISLKKFRIGKKKKKKDYIYWKISLKKFETESYNKSCDQKVEKC